MKYIFFFFLCYTLCANAQSNLPVVYLPESLTLHFISPEPIQYVDISSKDIVGDLPLKNLLRLKLKDSLKTVVNAVITITGEKFIAQYHVLSGGQNSPTEINIVPADMKPLDISGIGFSQNQLKTLTLGLMSRKPDRNREQSKSFGITATLNHVYTLGDYIFLDLDYRNKTNLRYDINELRFRIDDKKILKATNVQSIEIQPVFEFAEPSFFKRHYRNVFVFKKLSFPGNKVLHIELSEKQVSGRIINLDVSYKEILEADALTYN